MAEWRAVAGFPQYEVSDDGRLRRTIAGGPGGKCRAGMEVKSSLGPGGYLKFNLWDGKRNHSVRAHRLVLLTFGPPCLSPSHHAAHNDGDRQNNVITNLRWATAKENQADRWLHGTRQSGAAVVNAKLTQEQASTIRALAASGEPVRGLARRYAVNRWTIKKIVQGRSYAAL